MRRLALARAISFCGSASAYVALASAIYASTGSAAWVSAVALASFGTPALVSPIAGAIGDHFDRRRVMIVSELLGAACFAVMALVSAPAALVAIKVLAALVAAPATPASGAVVPMLAPRGALAGANSTVIAAGTAGVLVGPLLGGALVVASGAPLVFVVNAVSFLVSALLLAGLRGPLPARRSPERGTGRLRAGFSAIWSDRVLRSATLGFGVVYLGVGFTFAAELVLASDFGAGAGGYGAVVASWGLGGLLGAWLARHALRRWSAPSLLAAAAAGIAASFLATGAAPVFALVIGALTVAGLCEGVAEVGRALLVQNRAAEGVRSRAVAAAEAADQAALAIALLFAGPLVAGLGAQGAFACAGALCAAGALILARRSPRPGNLKEMTRSEPAFEVPERNAVLGTPLQPPFPDGIEVAYFAMGCFWGAERLFWELDGVYTTAVGYMNGTTEYPTYEEVCTGRTGHAESVLVAFDPEKISYADLLRVFFEEHDPTQGMRQGNDIGTQYRSGIFFADDAQKDTAEMALRAYDEDLRAAGREPITTEVEPAGPFYYAEDYHQQYLHKVPNGYCGLAGTGVTCRIPAAS